ncbi:MAG: dTDP-4-dehydrorhamnose reductase [Gemmatimonas sp.]
MRILIFGGSGQTGTALQATAPQHVLLQAPSSTHVNLTDAASIARAVVEGAPDVIINCAAYTKVDDAERDTEAARLINAVAPAVMADAAKRTGARVIHVSTDYVFDGRSNAPYVPQAAASPLNVYGATKLEGERALLAAAPESCVVRTAWVHSGGGINFVATAVRVLSAGNVMRVVDDQISTPTSALSLASALWRLADQRTTHGVLHYTDAGVASWYDVAHCVLETLRELGAAKDGAEVLPVDSTAFPRPASRPPVSILDKHASWTLLGMTPAHWRVGVAQSTRAIIEATRSLHRTPTNT